MSRFRRALSFSNVVAFIALFVALGGSVYAAAKINGKQIKPKSIPANRIKPASITGTQIKPGSLTGTQVVGSSLTGVSAGALGSVQYAGATVTLTNGFGTAGTTARAACPAGTKVIGGGATVSTEKDAFVNDSGPIADRSGWTATGFSEVPSSTMTVTAICTAVTSATG
jgi:hypothetical protein